MITCVQRKDLSVEKYQRCIETSVQRNIYASVWYLDIVCEHWCVLVLNDYEAVMPIPWRKKYGVTYAYPPLWLLELGVFSKQESSITDNFLKTVFKEFKFVELRMNVCNRSTTFSSYLLDKQMHRLPMHDVYDDIFSGYRKDRKKDVRKAQNACLQPVWNATPRQLIELFKNNIGKRVATIQAQDYLILEKLMHVCLEKGVGELLAIYDTEERLVAAGFFLKNEKEVTLLVSSTDLQHRNNGANTFLIDTAIKKYHTDFTTFNFGGSSMPSIANYFLSFGAETTIYPLIKYNNLPRLLKWLKR